MTEKGTFIINGAERVIVFSITTFSWRVFDASTHPNGTKLDQARIILCSWIRGVDFTTDINDCLFVLSDKKKKISCNDVTPCLRLFIQ